MGIQTIQVSQIIMNIKKFYRPHTIEFELSNCMKKMENGLWSLNYPKIQKNVEYLSIYCLPLVCFIVKIPKQCFSFMQKPLVSPLSVSNEFLIHCDLQITFIYWLFIHRQLDFWFCSLFASLWKIFLLNSKHCLSLLQGYADSKEAVFFLLHNFMS